MEIKFFVLDEDPIDARLDQMADLLELRKQYQCSSIGKVKNTHIIRDAVITLSDEIRIIRLKEAGSALSAATLMRFSRKIPVEPGWYWLRGKLDCDVMVHVFQDPSGLSFCDGLDEWTETDPRMAGYQFAGPIPAGV